MKASDVMTRDIVSIGPDAAVGVAKVEDHLIWIEPNSGVVVGAPED